MAPNTPTPRTRTRGFALLEAVIASALIAFTIYSATSARLSLNTLSQNMAAKNKISQAIKEYSFLLYQYSGDLRMARGKNFNEWKANLTAFCEGLVTQQQSSASNGNSTDNLFSLWSKNFNLDASTLDFQLDKCSISSPGNLPNLLQIKLDYSWRDIQKQLKTSAQQAPLAQDRQTDSMYISAYKPL